jgi:hypothetical protein
VIPKSGLVFDDTGTQSGIGERCKGLHNILNQRGWTGDSNHQLNIGKNVGPDVCNRYSGNETTRGAVGGLRGDTHVKRRHLSPNRHWLQPQQSDYRRKERQHSESGNEISGTNHERELHGETNSLGGERGKLRS